MPPGFVSNVWIDLAAARQAQDARLVQRLSCGQRRRRDLRVVRDVVSQARGMLGLEATFCDLEIAVQGDRCDVVVWYRFPQAAGTAGQALEAVSFRIDAPVPATGPGALPYQGGRRSKATAAGMAPRTDHRRMSPPARAEGRAARLPAEVLRRGHRAAPHRPGGPSRPPTGRCG